MNDRYLYKAKRIDNGGWVEGYYFKKKIFKDSTAEEHFIMTSKEPKRGRICKAIFFVIDQSTICQCTGLKDKNGKLIWENDILELYDRNTDYRWRSIVRFGNPNCEYTWGWQLEPIGKCEANKDILCWIEMEESGAFCEIIGNIFDNTELLEVGE